MALWLQFARPAGRDAEPGRSATRRDRGSQRSNEVMKKTILIISLGLLTLIAVLPLFTRSGPASKQLSQPEFIALVQSNLLGKVRVYYPPKPGQVDGVSVMLHDVRGTFYRTDAAGQIVKAEGIPKESPFVARVQLSSELQLKLTTRTNFAAVSPNPLVLKVSQWFGHAK